MKQWIVFGLLLLIVVALVLYARSCSGYAPEDTPIDVVPTQLPQVPTQPPPPVPEPSPVVPQPIPDKQATSTADGDFPESLSMSSFVVTSDLSEVDTSGAEKDLQLRLKKPEGPPEQDIEMERRKTYSEWSP